MLPLTEYQQQRPHIFPSLDSLRWFIRQNHAALIERHALLMPTGRKLISPGLFDAFVVEVGAKKAQERRACHE